MKRNHLNSYLTFVIILTSVSSSLSNPSPDSRKYGNSEYDKDMLESVLKEVLNDEITKLSKPGIRGEQRGISDDRIERLDHPAPRKLPASHHSIGMDDYLDRLGSSSERQSQSSSDYRSTLVERPSLSDEYQEKPRGRDKSESLSDSNPHQQQQPQQQQQQPQSSSNYRDLQQEVMMLEEKLRMEKSMRQKLEQQEAAKLREEKLLQEKLREERKKMEQMYADEKVRHGDGGSSSGRRHKVKQHIDHSDLLDGINDASDASDLERINLKSYSAAMASAHDSDSVLKALSASDSDEISLKSLSHSLSHSDPSAKFFKQHPELLDDSLTTSSLSSLRPSSHLSSSALESSIRPSFGSLSHSSLLSPKSLHGRPHGHINYGMPNFGPGFGSAHAASSISPSFGPKFPPPFMSPFMPGPPMRGPRPMPGGPMPGFPGRPFAPGMSPFPGSMGSFGSASSLSPARFPPPPPMSQSSLHSIAASMYPSLYPNGNPHQRSSPLLPNSPITIGSSPASTTGSATTAATEGDKKDPKTGKKLKSMLMDFAVSSILDVGMLNLMGNILGKMNAEPGT